MIQKVGIFKMVFKMAAFYRKIQLEIKIAVNNYFLIVFDSGLFEEFDLFAVVFSAVKYSR